MASQNRIAQCLLSLACIRLHRETRSSSESTTKPSAGCAVPGSYLQPSRATHRPRNSSLLQICGHVSRLPIQRPLLPAPSVSGGTHSAPPELFAVRPHRITVLAEGVKKASVAESRQVILCSRTGGDPRANKTPC